ncbi:ABC transporter ATP-binding protein [Thermopolyspora sp. NPDC052614]|uniref:ABC transporter ATP-binding protein n=1 Tax=Thermopolyspora sp. NPDC052614 TaxID=3155682 RepID=UPI0034467075
MPDFAITTAEVSKRFGAVLAVDGVSLSVRRGEIYALLGLNGAGKTTLIRMLLGMIRPTAGSARVLGVTVGDDRSIWSKVGYLVESPAAYPELTVRENLEIIRRLRRLPDPRAVDDVMERLSLTPHVRAGTLSMGNAQRLALAKALIHRPDLLILDEPVNGLDPAGVVEIRTMLLELRDQGVTVFLSSHILAEVARLATRIGIIHRGRLREEFDAADLDSRVRRRLMVATRDNDKARAILAAEGFETIDPLDPPHHLDPALDPALAPAHDRREELALPATVPPDQVATVLVHAGCPPTRLATEEEDLETYFLRAVGAHHDAAS